MIKRITEYAKNHKKTTLVAFVVIGLVVVAVVLLIANTGSDSKETTKKKPKVFSAPSYNYVYVSSYVTCAQVQPYPNASSTVNNCSGRLNVTTDPGGKAVTFKVTNSTQYLSKNGIAIELSKLNQLQSDKSKLSVNPAGEKSDTANVIFNADQVN